MLYDYKTLKMTCGKTIHYFCYHSSQVLATLSHFQWWIRRVDQKGHLRIRQLDLIATCLSTLDLEELTKVETSFELWHADIICGLG